MKALHDYECECGMIIERFQDYEERTTECPKCSGQAKRIISYRSTAKTVDVFTPYREEHLGDDAPLVESKQHLARLCRERGMVSRHLAESYRNYDERRREI